MRRILLALLIIYAPAAWAQIGPSNYPAATVPLNGVDAVLLDQGSGCATHVAPCTTSQAASTRIGQPVQRTTAPTSPFQYQQWIDTSLSPPKLKEFIGSTWFVIANLDPTNGFSFTIPATSVTGLGTMAMQNAVAVAITGGTITGMPTPTNGGDVASKSYVDSVATALVPQTAVKYATAAILPNTPTYSNGASGVGATLTAGSNTTLTVDGNVAGINDRVLVKNQADQTQNGCYAISQVGSGAAPWVLTRCIDWDQSAEMKKNSYFFTSAGSVNAATSWFSASGGITVGASAIVFQQFSASNVYSASTGLTLGGSAFSITATGVAATSYGTATQVPTITVNAQGQITTASNTSISIPATQITSGLLSLARGGTAADLTATGGTAQVLRQSSAGAAITVGQLAASNLSNGTTGSGAVMLAASPTTTGTLTAATINAVQYNLSGVILAANDGTHNVLYDASSSADIFLGGVGDSSNYYRNTVHYFQSVAGGTTFATMASAGLVVATGDLSITSGIYQRAGVSLLSGDANYNFLFDRAGNTAIYLGGGGTADATNYYRNTAHSFGSIGGGVTYATLDASGLALTVPLAVTSGGTGGTTSTGSGAVMLAESPTTTGTLTAAAINASGIIATSAQASTFGNAAGSKTSPTNANTNILLYNLGSTNYAAIGAHTNGDMYFVTGTSGTPATRLVIGTTGLLQFNAYGTGALSTDGSGNVSSGTLAVTNGGTGVTTSTGTGSVVLSASPTFSGTVNGVALNFSSTASITGTTIVGGDLQVGVSNSFLRGSSGALSLFAGGTQALVVNTTTITSNVGIGIGIAPSHELQLLLNDGFKPGGGTWGDSSDGRLKTNLVSDFDALDKVRQLKPTLFDWKDPGAHSGIPQQKRVDLKATGVSGAPIEGGFIAQDLQKVFPDFVSQSDCRDSAECAEVGGGKVYTVTYPNKFNAYLVKAIQQLDERLKALEAK